MGRHPAKSPPEEILSGDGESMSNLIEPLLTEKSSNSRLPPQIETTMSKTPYNQIMTSYNKNNQIQEFLTKTKNSMQPSKSIGIIFKS